MKRLRSPHKSEVGRAAATAAAKTSTPPCAEGLWPFVVVAVAVSQLLRRRAPQSGVTRPFVPSLPLGYGASDDVRRETLL